MYPTRGQLNAIRVALALTGDDFEKLYFSWKREADPIPTAFLIGCEKPEQLVAFLDKSIEFARQLRRSGQPRMAMNLCERDIDFAYSRIKELCWSAMHICVLTKIAELSLEQCKSGLDFLSRADVGGGALTVILRRLHVIESACSNEISHFYAELAAEGATYVAGDVRGAFKQSMKLVENQSAIPVPWKAEVLRATAINAGKLGNREALEYVANLIEHLFEAAGDRIASGEQAFVLEGLARGWAIIDPECAQVTIERAWKSRRASVDAESGSLLRYVQLIRSEAEIASVNREGSDVRGISMKVRDALRISEEHGYDRHADQFKVLLKDLI